MAAAKAAFMDSQHDELLSVGQESVMDSTSRTTLDFDEWLECLARLGVMKYQSVKQLTHAAAVKGFLANFFGDMSEEDVMREGTCTPAATRTATPLHSHTAVMPYTPL